jgi:predicted HTH domain antitoxin
VGHSGIFAVRVELLFFGKACELAKLDYRKFGEMLGDRPINRHDSETELEEDLDYLARR